MQHVGEVIAWRNLFWSLSEAMVRNPKPWVDGYVLPDGAAASAYQVIATIAYPKVIGTEYGARHELYEINYGGSTEEIRRYALFSAMGNGNAAKFKGFAEQCMEEYDLNGWTAPDLINPDDLSYHKKPKK